MKIFVYGMAMAAGCILIAEVISDPFSRTILVVLLAGGLRLHYEETKSD